LQHVASKSDIICGFIKAQNVSANILELKYSANSATVIIEMPALPQGRVTGFISPRSNFRNSVSFGMNILSSVPFQLDAFSLSPSVVYQDHDDFISIRVTGVPPFATASNFLLVLGSFAISSEHMKFTASASRTDFSLFQFHLRSLSSAGFSARTELNCLLTYSGTVQIFTLTIFPSKPVASVVSFSPSLFRASRGTIISVVASFLREILQPLKPQVFVDGVNVTSAITSLKYESDKFQTSVSFFTPPMAAGIRQFRISHPIVNSSVTFDAHAFVPSPVVTLQSCKVLRSVNTTCRLELINFGIDTTALIIKTNSTLAGLDYTSENYVASVQGQPQHMDSSSFVSVNFPPPSFSHRRSQVIWIASISTLQATFVLSIEASNLPFLSSISPLAISAYGGVPVLLFVSLAPVDSAAMHYVCSFPLGNVTATQVSRTDLTSVTVTCIPPLNHQALTISVYEQSCKLIYASPASSFVFSSRKIRRRRPHENLKTIPSVDRIIKCECDCK
jgi:hypothetical protein